mmetsp:Transcript_111958/g.327398  ORF Transcript_111958/g.327398 Transcript_111958/m.327398 type:complete len:206 (-) Transcript_111958:1598-2215(-)
MSPHSSMLPRLTNIMPSLLCTSSTTNMANRSAWPASLSITQDWPPWISCFSLLVTSPLLLLRLFHSNQPPDDVTASSKAQLLMASCVSRVIAKTMDSYSVFGTYKSSGQGSGGFAAAMHLWNCTQYSVFTSFKSGAPRIATRIPSTQISKIWHALTAHAVPTWFQCDQRLASEIQDPVATLQDVMHVTGAVSGALTYSRLPDIRQ